MRTIRLGRLLVQWRGGWDYLSPGGWRGTVARWAFSKVTPAPRAFRWWIIGPVEIQWFYRDDPQTVEQL